ncbi:MAG: hypothetical protein ABJN42_12125, partial [Roseibium sp.]|uniref:hypothetical protein n=1 Tax=Roseibium sp. TaxID=1936156 RepID=UPI003296BAEA
MVSIQIAMINYRKTIKNKSKKLKMQQPRCTRRAVFRCHVGGDWAQIERVKPPQRSGIDQSSGGLPRSRIRRARPM